MGAVTLKTLAQLATQMASQGNMAIKRKLRQLKENDNSQDMRKAAHQIDNSPRGNVYQKHICAQHAAHTSSFYKKILLEVSVLRKVPRHYAECRYVFVVFHTE